MGERTTKQASKPSEPASIAPARPGGTPQRCAPTLRNPAPLGYRPEPSVARAFTALSQLTLLRLGTGPSHPWLGRSLLCRSSPCSAWAPAQTILGLGVRCSIAAHPPAWESSFSDGLLWQSTCRCKKQEPVPLTPLLLAFLPPEGTMVCPRFSATIQRFEDACRPSMTALDSGQDLGQPESRRYRRRPRGERGATCDRHCALLSVSENAS